MIFSIKTKANIRADLEVLKQAAKHNNKKTTGYGVRLNNIIDISIKSDLVEGK